MTTRKSIFSNNYIQYSQIITNRYLQQSSRAIDRDIINIQERNKAFDFLNNYEVSVENQQRLGLKLRTSTRTGLHGVGWVHNTEQTLRLAIKAYGLDGITGKIVIQPTRHHMNYDKSRTADIYLLHVDHSTNRLMYPRRAQQYLGGPVVHSPQSLLFQDISFKGKEAFLRGDPNPVWLEGPITGQPQHWYYRPRSTRMFYWCKRNVDLYGLQWLEVRIHWIRQNIDLYGTAWLNSPQAQALLEPRRSFMSHLDIGPP